MTNIYTLDKCSTSNLTGGKPLKWQVTENNMVSSSTIYLFRTKKEAERFIKQQKVLKENKE